MPFHSAPHGRTASAPACCRPLAGVVSPVLPTDRRLTAAVTWGGGTGCGRVWDPPLQRGRDRRAPVRAPLKRGLSPPSGGDWGFLVSCRGHGERRGKKPSATASPCHLPFQGRFLKRLRTDGAQRRGRQGVGRTLKLSICTLSSRPSAEGPAPHPTTMPGGMCQARRTPRGQRPPASTQGRPQWAGRGSGDHSIPPRR